MLNIETKAKKLLESRTIIELCADFEATNNINGNEIPIVRGWIMDELERRDQKTFTIWMDTDNELEMDNPSLIYL